MPTYVYECSACGNQVEVVQRVSDPPLTSCDHCQGELRKKFFPSRVIFKGSGWYITDSKATTASKPEGAESEAAPATEGAAKEKATTATATKPSEPATKSAA